MNKPVAALILLLRFLWAVVLSGWQTLKVILTPESQRPQPRFMRMHYAPMSDAGASLLGCMITLTPGTTTIDIDPERRELLLHVLDGSDPEGVVAGVRRDFEPYCIALFGENRS